MEFIRKAGAILITSNSTNATSDEGVLTTNQDIDTKNTVLDISGIFSQENLLL
jgi:hypothetical protein